MISFVVENFSINKTIQKTPKYKLKVRLLKSNMISCMLKFVKYSILNLNTSDKFFSYFTFVRFLNRSTITLNLSLSYYYKSLKILDNSNSNLKTVSLLGNFNSSIKLLGLPISFKMTNFIFFYTIHFNLTYYAPFYKFYTLKQHYFYNQKLLSTYNNLNYYYSKVYEH